MPEPTPTPAIHNASITPNTRVRIASSTTRCSSVRPTTSSTVSAPPAARVATTTSATPLVEPARTKPAARTIVAPTIAGHSARRPTNATDPAAPASAPSPAAVCSAPTPESPQPSTSIATDTSSTSKAPHATVISAAKPTSRRGPGERAITPKACPASITNPHGRRRPDDAGAVCDPSIRTASAPNASITAAAPYTRPTVPTASSTVTDSVPSVLPRPSPSEETEFAAVTSSGVWANVGMSEWCAGREVVIVTMATTAPAYTAASGASRAIATAVRPVAMACAR